MRPLYSDLKKRVQGAKDNPGAAFVELKLPDMPGAYCIVEMEKPNGAKMKMHFKGQTTFDLLQLGKVFWSSEP